MSRVDSEFKDRVYRLVERIPEGKVITYGQIAAISGAPWAAWEVGQIAHYGPTNLPWHRVVSKKGGLARGFVPGGQNRQRELLVAEGIILDKENNVKIGEFVWNPQNPLP